MDPFHAAMQNLGSKTRDGRGTCTTSTSKSALALSCTLSKPTCKCSCHACSCNCFAAVTACACSLHVVQNSSPLSKLANLATWSATELFQNCHASRCVVAEETRRCAGVLISCTLFCPSLSSEERSHCQRSAFPVFCFRSTCPRVSKKYLLMTPRQSLYILTRNPPTAA